MNNLIKTLLLILITSFIVSCDNDDDPVNPTPEQITYGLEVTRTGINNFTTLGSEISFIEDSIGIKTKTINKPSNKDLETAEDNKMKLLLTNGAAYLRSRFTNSYFKNDTAIFGEFNKYYTLFKDKTENVLATDSIKPKPF